MSPEPPDEPTRAEWRDRHHFAEFAEALGVDTDHVIAVRSVPKRTGLFVVMLSPDLVKAPKKVEAAYLQRDAVGILRESGRRRDVPDFWERLP